jgi:16S rRNA A1518/A1519 N6-dimethyltransferase RsmA/KsgA/DIM1 with predicted DNA glycosylase/AP lyase activity
MTLLSTHIKFPSSFHSFGFNEQHNVISLLVISNEKVKPANDVKACVRWGKNCYFRERKKISQNVVDDSNKTAHTTATSLSIDINAENIFPLQFHSLALSFAYT